MEEFPASKVHLQPATWLTGKFPSRRMYPSITGQFGCGLRAQLRPSVVRGGGGLGGLWHITHRSYSRHQVHSDTLNYLFPSNTFRPRTYCFLHVSHPAKIASRTNIFEEQIHWISPEGGHGWTSVKEIKTDCNLAFKNLVLKPNSFSKFIFIVCGVWYNAWKTLTVLDWNTQGKWKTQFMHFFFLEGGGGGKRA